MTAVAPCPRVRLPIPAAREDIGTHMTPPGQGWSVK